MRRVIISTIGTSLLTQQINRSNPAEKDWYAILRDTANLTNETTPNETQNIIRTLQDRANNKLKKVQIKEIRSASAELNGIYGIYQNDINQGKEDIHFLIATDTMQGLTTAEIVKNFLNEQYIYNVTIKTPPGLSTVSTEDFSLGIDELLVWLENVIPPLKEQGYLINFNLVGGFKSLQGYLNTIGMFYADEINYIFEGENSELITIPRLPITVDTKSIEPYIVPLALLDAGAALSPTQTEGIPETVIAEIDGKMTLSTWGQLIWNRSKLKLLSGELQIFPRLIYQDSFKADYKQIRDEKERVKLQETLAKVSHLLEDNRGDVSILKKDGGLRYDKYTNKNNIEHFRVTQGRRISCHAEQGELTLYHYGEHEVNENPYQ